MEENEKEDKKAEEKNEDKKDEKNDNKKYKKNKAKDLIQNIDNNFKQDSATFLENLKRFDKKREKEKVPNISNNLNQIKNNEGTEDDFTMNVNETLIDPYPNLDNPFRQNGDYLNLSQNQEQINLLRIIADNLTRENHSGISYSVILIGYIIFFIILTNRFHNSGGFDYSASRSLYYMILALSCFISVIYLKEIVKANKKNKNK